MNTCQCYVCRNTPVVEMPKEKDVLVRFKMFFQSLETSDKRSLYKFMCALRGPDNADESEKAITTAVIRSYLLNGADENNLGCIVNFNQQDGLTEYYTNPKNSHFSSHIRMAMSEIKKSNITRG